MPVSIWKACRAIPNNMPDKKYIWKVLFCGMDGLRFVIKTGTKQKKAPDFRQGPGGRKNEVLEESVSCSMYGFNVLGRVFVFPEFLAQPFDVNINRTVGDVNLFAPDFFQDFFS